MITVDEIRNRLENTLTPKRLTHSLNVMNTAVEMSKVYGENEKNAAVTGLIHDCARDICGEEIFRLCEKFNIAIDDVTRVQPKLLHGHIGAQIARLEYGISDESILKAVFYHTLGHENMSMLEKIVFIADYIEPGRDFPEVDKIRKKAENSLEKALIVGFESTILLLISKKQRIYPLTILARNALLEEISK